MGYGLWRNLFYCWLSLRVNRITRRVVGFYPSDSCFISLYRRKIMSGNNTNIVVLTGRLGREPQVINANTKVPFAILNLAINKKWKKDGNSHERTNWIKIKLNNTNVTQYLNKGDPVAITGELISSSREIEGKKRTSFYVKAK